MTLLYDELRDAVAGRGADSRVDSSGRRLVALSVRFARPIADEAVRAIAAETPHANVRIPGVLTPIGIERVPGCLTLILDPIDPATLRLDTLLAALDWSGSPLGSPLSAYVVVELCRAAHALHHTAGADGRPRVHHEIHSGTVLVDPGGHLRLFGPGLPAISAAMLPRLANRGDRHRLLSPEAARGEPLDPRADVYSLGVLYYELLSGRRYREKLNPSSVAQAAVEGRPPELPGALPDPRRALVQVLSRALAPDAEQRFPSARMFAEAIVGELASARIPLPEPSVLERMIDEFVPAGVERGKSCLLHAEHDTAAFESIMAGLADTANILPAEPVPPPQQKRLSPDVWSKVLGEDVHRPATEPAPASARPMTPTPSPPPSSGGLSLPMPTTDRSSGTPALTKPLSGEHLAQLARPPARSRHLAPPAAEEKGKHTAVRVAIGLAGLALAVAVGFGLKARPSHPAEADLKPQPPPPPVAAVMDAGVRVAAAPDANVVEQAKPVGLLTVMSKPLGAAVEIDGGFVGKTPLVLKHDFKNRPYLVRVLADGYEVWEETAYPDGKLAISLMAVLVKK